MRQITKAKVEGDNLKSTTLTYIPQDIRGGS
jgi:RNA 3''-terminal phosphate cyclase